MNTSLSIQATPATVFPPAEKPTMYFIGVTTAQSSIMRVFPVWARLLGLGDVQLRGIDCKWHDDPAVYRRVVSFIKHDPLSLGALVTTHKIDLLHATRDLFDDLDPFASMLGEISSISKNGSRLAGHAKDPITAGLSLEAFLPPGHWERTRAEVFLLGAGGSSIALSHYLMKPAHGPNRPACIHVANRSAPRLEEIRHLHQSWASGLPTTYTLTPQPELADALCSALPPGSLVVNATGLGKDAPGSPLTAAASFPQDGFAWEFNYRGDLLFLRQAQAASRRLHVEDGWIYFIHGWTRVISEVFHLPIPVSGPAFDALSQAAATAGKPTPQP